MTYKLEVTDTIGGEANYCWVKRGTTAARSRRGIVEAVKSLAGWHGWCRVKVESYGDGYCIRPTDSSGVCQIAFAQWDDTAEEPQKMVVFEHGLDSRVREATAPTVAKFHIGGGVYRFIVIGTQYGYWHTSGGDVRTWRTASGARRAAKRYVAL